MTKANSTRSTRAPKEVPIVPASLSEMSDSLNDYACLLAGIEDVCRSHVEDGNDLYLAAEVCRQINVNLSTMAMKLNTLDQKGGAA